LKGSSTKPKQKDKGEGDGSTGRVIVDGSSSRLITVMRNETNSLDLICHQWLKCITY